jgi:hypothetical protein
LLFVGYRLKSDFISTYEMLQLPVKVFNPANKAVAVEMIGAILVIRELTCFEI